MKKKIYYSASTGFIVVAVVLLTVFSINMSGCRDQNSQTLTDTAAGFSNDSQMVSDTVVGFGENGHTGKNWTFYVNVQLPHDTTYFAQTKSTNDAAPAVTLEVEKHEEGTTVDLFVWDPMFLSNGKAVSIKFDNNEPISVGYTPNAQDTCHAIFLESPDRIFHKLTSSKKMIVEADFLKIGRQQLEFDVDGFDWNH